VTNPALQVTAAPVPGSPKTSGSGHGSGAAAPARAIATEEFETHPPIALRKGSNNPAFMISWRSRREVAMSLRWKSTLMIWGGPALALLSLYFLLSMLNLL